jgi:hypothetical protein
VVFHGRVQGLVECMLGQADSLGGLNGGHLGRSRSIRQHSRDVPLHTLLYCAVGYGIAPCVTVSVLYSAVLCCATWCRVVLQAMHSRLCPRLPT